MKRLIVTWSMAMALGLGLVQAARAETRLYVPQFKYGGSEETQFLIANGGVEDANVSLWAFTSQGELVGQYQLVVKAHGTRSVTIGEAFKLGDAAATGWVGAVSESDAIQMTYTRIGAVTESFEAQDWSSREIRLNLSEAGKEAIHLSNPNAFAASVTVQALDSVGNVVGNRTVSLAAFSQADIPSLSIGESAARLNVVANADVLASIVDDRKEGLGFQRKFSGDASEEMMLVIDGAKSLGAYQVTLAFDPKAVQFSAKDVDGGAAEGFDSKPLVVNIDNAAGLMTIASFQVGSRPEGRSAVARLRVTHIGGMAARFGIKIDEVTDTEGNSLVGSGLSVGLVRTK